MYRVGGARRNQPHIGDRPRHPRIALVDRVAVFIQLKTAIEVRAWLDRTSATVANFTAVKDCLTLVVDRFKLDPYVKRINGAAGKEVPDFARSHDHFNADGIASTNRSPDFIEWRDH